MWYCDISRPPRRALAAGAMLLLSLVSTAATAGVVEECTAQFQRGNQAYQKGDYPRATPSLERAARCAESAFGATHTNVAVIYNQLAATYMAQNRFADAEPFLLRALHLREQISGADSPDLIPALSNLAQVYDNQGRYAEAEAVFNRVLAIQQIAAGPNAPSVALTLVNLANLDQHRGLFKDAERAYQRALSIAEQAFGSDHPNLLFVIDNFAALYANDDRNGMAIALMQRSLAIKQKAMGANYPALGTDLTKIAQIYEQDGRTADAEEIYKRVLAICEQQGRDNATVGAALNNLAAFYRARNRFAEAEPLYRRALPIQEKTHGPGSAEVATTLINLAVLYDKQGRTADAEPLYNRSLAIDQRIFGPDSEEVASDVYALALFTNHNGRATEAEPLFKRALAIREKLPLFNPSNIAISLSGLAACYDAQGRADEALAAARQAVATWTQNNGAASHEAGIRRMKEFLPELIRLLHQAYAGAGTSPPDIMEEAFRATQYAHGIGTAQALTSMTARYASGSDALAALIRDRQDLATRSRALSAAVIKVLSQPPGQRGPNAEMSLRREQSEVDARLTADDARLRNEFPRFAELARTEPVGIAAVQQVLDPDEAFVAFTLADKDGYLFVLRKDKAAFTKLDLTSAQATESVRGLRTRLIDGSTFPVDDAYRLYHRLLAPADGLIAGAKTLIVVPDGALESLPLSVLVTAPPDQAAGQPADDKHVAWLVRRQAMMVMPAASSLVSLRQFAVAQRPRQPFAGFGNPNFGRAGPKRTIDPMISRYQAVADRLRNLPALADTADELRAEAKILGAPPESLYLGNNASVTMVKSIDLATTRIVAFATHAGMAGELAGVDEPALVLTPPERATESDDGLLRASQISQLKLNADFVILSACNTAASDGTPDAEGLSGLAKAFFYAGARSLLVSHWEVESAPTVKLTTGLIRAIAADPSIGRAEALRRSMLAMIDRPVDPDDIRPTAWAPFVLAGEGGANR